MNHSVRADAAAISPITGWTRAEWTALADRLLAGVRPYASPQHARITLPGPAGGYGSAVDGLEGFARTFLLAGFRLAGENGRDEDGLAEWYARGIASGVDPSSVERWVRPDEHPQAKVEAASIALILDLTRPWIWDRLESAVQERVVEYLAPVVGDDDYPRCNWVWFRIVVETFLRSVGGPWSATDIEADLAAHDEFYRADGWFADGDERSFDHYGGWALHLYPALWARMRGADELAAARQQRDSERLDAFLGDYVRLIGADGSPLIQGRSLTYRFAAAAPLWVGALAGVTSVEPGRLRRAASGIVRHFADHGAPDDRDLLTLGWHHSWPALAQSYSGPSSPYWAAKGMLGLALPADHPVWTAPELPLPVEEGDQLWSADSPGWLVSATSADGIVRVVNHGTDHAVEGSRVGDSPLYTRLGYSTGTSPLLSPGDWQDPLDQSVVLLDAAGRATHRAGMRTVSVGTANGDVAAVAASTARAHWMTETPGQPDHGSGRSGDAVDAAAVTTVSIVRGAWEVRCVRVDPLPDAPEALAAATRVRIGGWPLAGAKRPIVAITDGAATVHTPRAESVVAATRGLDEPGAHESQDAGPLGPYAATPWVTGPVVSGRWSAVVIGLIGSPGSPISPSAPESTDARLLPDVTWPAADAVAVSWPDGEFVTVPLPTDVTVPPSVTEEAHDQQT
jgi:hypothetical protein